MPIFPVEPAALAGALISSSNLTIAPFFFNSNFAGVNGAGKRTG